MPGGNWGTRRRSPAFRAVLIMPCLSQLQKMPFSLVENGVSTLFSVDTLIKSAQMR
jgi:hypothetical protein